MKLSEEDLVVLDKLRKLEFNTSYNISEKDLKTVKKLWKYINTNDYCFTLNDEHTKIKRRPVF